MPRFLVAALLAASALAADLARGWGDDIPWVTLSEGLAQAKAAQKPLMLLIHKSWCGACKALRPKFEASPAIRAEMGSFVMVNALDDEEPAEAWAKPGGAGYIPRVLFLTPQGDVMEDVQSGNEQYKYFYGGPEGIAASMRVAAQRAAAAALEGAEAPPPAEEDL